MDTESMRDYSQFNIPELLKKIDLGYTPTKEESLAIRECTELNGRAFGDSLPSSIGLLCSLKSLNLLSTPISSLPNAIGQLTKLEILKLRNTRISQLPDAIGQLTSLQSLDLRDTLISKLPDTIGKIASLKELQLFHTNIKSLPESIGNLVNLEILNLDGTRISYLPDSIGNLSSLNYLNLNDSRITTLPNTIGNLINLKHLWLRSSAIERLPETISKLSNLQTLVVDKSSLEELPESFGELTSLDNFGLDSDIKRLPDSIGNLSSLKYFYLHGTQITELPQSIGLLKKLNRLEIIGTPIKSLPYSIGQLSNLHELVLSSTKLTELPDSIGQLSYLEELDISNTKITELPDSINSLPELWHIDISKTPISTLPKAVALGSHIYRDEDEDENIITPYSFRRINATETRLPDYYFAGHDVLARYLEFDGKQMGFCEAKVLFLGDGNAGKTYTVNRFLANGEKENPSNPYSIGQTHGVKPYEYRYKKDGLNYALHLWDFGGQEILHAMHRCFLTVNTVYVIMISTRNSEHNRRLRYWLYGIRPFVNGAKVLVVINVFENIGIADIDIAGLQMEFSPEIKLEFITLSVKDESSDGFREKLMREIITLAEEAEKLNGRHPIPYMIIRNRVRDAFRNDNSHPEKNRWCITGSDFVDFCTAEGVTNPHEQSALLRYFANIGVCFCVIGTEDQEIPANTRLVTPVWITNALYAIIEECLPIRGWIDLDRIYTCLSNPPKNGKTVDYHRIAPEISYSKEDCIYLTQVAVQFSLAHKETNPIGQTAYFFPGMCRFSDKSVDFLNGPINPKYSVSYEVVYRYLPDSIVHRLMMECLRRGYQHVVCWRGGFRFENGARIGVVDTVDGDRRLLLRFWSTEEDSPVIELLRQFRGYLGLDIADKAGPQEYIVYNEELFSVRQLLNAKRRGIAEVASEWTPEVAYDVRMLLGAYPIENAKKTSLPVGTKTINNNFSYNVILQGKNQHIQLGNIINERQTIFDGPQVDVCWERFNVNNKNAQSIAFEKMCRQLFRLEYFDSSTILQNDPNNPGVEIHPQIATNGEFKGKRVSFQSKYYQGKPNYTDIRDSIEKTIQYYHTGSEPSKAIEAIVIYCNKELTQSKRNITYTGIKKQLDDLGIQLEIIVDEELLNRIQRYPKLTEKYFSVNK